MYASKSTAPNIVKFVVCLLVCFGVSIGGALFVNSDSLEGWYAQLEKPAFTPPDWLFAPVWTVLYFLMAVSAFLVWKKGLSLPHVKFALAFFLLQLVLNAAWTPLFFGLHLIGWSLADIIALLVAIIATIIAFQRVSKALAALLIPYLLWTAFATILNARLYQLNP